MFSKFRIVVSSISLLVHAVQVDAQCPDRIGQAGVQVRLPPTFAPSPDWTPPSASWYFKPWNMVYASSTQNQNLRNFQYDPTPISGNSTVDQVNDLSSFQVPNNNTVFTSYGVDTVNTSYTAVLEYAGTGILEGATSQYSVLAWGCDANSVPYYSSYATETPQTQTPAGIDIMSTSDIGPDQETVTAMINALQALDNPEITKLATALKETVQDGDRRGTPRVTTCDEYCKSNRNLLDIL